MTRCYDCQNYFNLTKKGTGGGVHFTCEEFRNWKASHPRTCVYCEINEDTLYALNIPNPRTKRRQEVIGVDRIQNGQPYTLENIQPCCPMCNQIKSQLLTHAEMIELSPTLSSIWKKRYALSTASCE